MDLRVLEYFLEIADTGNMTRAAENLHTSQSNLSRQLRDLERELACSLFVRGKRRMELTGEGVVLERRAREMMQIAALAREDIASFGDEVSGTVRIGAVETKFMRDVGKRMKELADRYPKIDYDIFSGSNAEIIERIDRGLLDFGIVVAPVDTTQLDNLALGMRERFGLIVPRDSPLVSKRCAEPEDVEHTPVWVAHQQMEGNVLSSWLGNRRLADVVGSFNLVNTPAMMADVGYGAVFTFEGLVNTEGTETAFVPLAPRMIGELYLVWKKGVTLSSAADAFLSEFKLPASS